MISFPVLQLCENASIVKHRLHPLEFYTNRLYILQHEREGIEPE